jgi:hypothetical protein
LGDYDTAPFVLDLDLIFDQRANVLRDEGTKNKFGGESGENRVVVARINVRFAWWETRAARSASREEAKAERTVFFTGGIVQCPLGSNVADGDHLQSIESVEGVVIVPGPLRVQAVQPYEDHVDVALMRP